MQRSTVLTGLVALTWFVACGGGSDDPAPGTSAAAASGGAAGKASGGAAGNASGGAAGKASGGAAGKASGGAAGKASGGAAGKASGGAAGKASGGAAGKASGGAAGNGAAGAAASAGVAGQMAGGAAGNASGGSAGGSGGAAGASGTAGAPAATCKAAPGGGSVTVQPPVLKTTLKDRWQEAWQASPAVADLDGDGVNEVVVARADQLVIWSPEGAVKAKVPTGAGRIWSSPVVGDLRPEPGLEIAFAAGNKLFVVDAAGAVMSGFPVTWVSELRSLAAGDLDGDGALELVVAPADGGKAGDVMNAWHAADGAKVAGFPPIKSGTSGCDAKCYIAGCYDQNVALGDLDGDGKADIVVGHDNAYASFHRGDGLAFDANPMFKAKKTPGVRYLHDLSLAIQGWADDEETALQAHFTNTAPSLADVDGDGVLDVILLGSVQNAAQTDRLKGVGLWVLHRDASRLAAWQEPFHAPDYLAGLWDFDGTNIVGATNQVAVAELDPSPGPELVFAGFDGRIHGVSAARVELWATAYTSDPSVLTGGVAIADLSGDGRPEVVFATYSPDQGKGELIVLGPSGAVLHRVPLPRRGAMPVPTIADVDGDGALEIVVSLKDAEDKVESVQLYTVAGSAPNCMPWPTGRGNLLRDGRANQQ